jgi:hypothetical protein
MSPGTEGEGDGDEEGMAFRRRDRSRIDGVGSSGMETLLPIFPFKFGGSFVSSGYRAGTCGLLRDKGSIVLKLGEEPTEGTVFGGISRDAERGNRLSIVNRVEQEEDDEECMTRYLNPSCDLMATMGDGLFKVRDFVDMLTDERWIMTGFLRFVVNRTSDPWK